MERLTNGIEYCKLHCDFGKSNECFFSNKYKCYERSIYNRLKDYEDAEEKGLLLRLPCKVGDVVYSVTRDFISKYTICNIEVYNEGFFFCWKCEKGIYINVRGFTNYQIGKDVFLTQAEAEQKLKEMESNYE